MLKVLLPFITLLLWQNSALASDKKIPITLAGSDYCPYVCLDENGHFQQQPGIHIEILREIFPSDTHIIKNVSVPWSRAIHLVRKGQADALNGAFKTDAPDLLYPQNPASQSQMCWFTRNDSQWRYENKESLKYVTTILIQDLSITEEIDSFFREYPNQKISISYEKYFAHFPTILARSNKSVFIEDRFVANHLMRNHWNQSFRQANCLDAIDMWLAFSPKSSASSGLIKQYDEGMEKLTSDGRLEAIYKNYLTGKNH